MTPINTITTAQIDTRLNQIAAIESEHAGRNPDQELSQAMLKGGDVDALESVQLEIERTARRLRAERIALETARPAAALREAQEKLNALAADHAELKKRMMPVAARVARLFAELTAAERELCEINNQASALTFEAYALANKTKADMPKLGTFQSKTIGERLQAFNEVHHVVKEMVGSGISIAGLIHGVSLD